jgi:hypothetical protein
MTLQPAHRSVDLGKFLLVLLAIALAPPALAETFPADVQEYLYDACMGGDPDREDFCLCILRELQNRLTMEEFTELDRPLPRKARKTRRNSMRRRVHAWTGCPMIRALSGKTHFLCPPIRFFVL